MNLITAVQKSVVNIADIKQESNHKRPPVLEKKREMKIENLVILYVDSFFFVFTS